MTLTKTIGLLREVILDENCKRMNLSTVKGYLGELLMLQQLTNAGFEAAEHQGNQTGYDLSVGKDKKFKIDVKTSTLKFELSRECKNWGWALQHENKKRPISATHFVCLGLDDKLEASQFIVIPANLAKKFPESIGRFSGVSHALFAFPPSSEPKKLSGESKQRIEECKRILQDKSIKVLYQGQSFHGVFS
jgi:hypothetical protein